MMRPANISLQQWAIQHQYATEQLALWDIQSGVVEAKLYPKDDGSWWVNPYATSLRTWAQKHSFPYSVVMHWYHRDILPMKASKTDAQGHIWIEESEPLRAVKLTTQFATSYKRSRIQHLLQAYRAAVNYFIRLLWYRSGKLNAHTLHYLKRTRLSARYKSQALKQAAEIVTSTRKSAIALGNKRGKCPVFTGGAKLDAKFVTLENSQSLTSFDICLTLSTLKSGSRITIPTKSTSVLNKWLAIPGAELVQGCELTEDGIIVWVRLPLEPYKTEGITTALDLGIHKFAVDAQGIHYGVSLDPEIVPGWKQILEKVARRQRGSAGSKRARAHRENFLNYILNRLPWEDWRFLGVENLDGIKQGKKNSSKKSRIIRTPWCQRRVRDRISDKAQENRVFLVPYDPSDTSRRCPSCSKVSKANRQGESFKCTSCGYEDDADNVGALNGYVKTCRLLGSLESPGMEKDNGS